MQRDPSKRVNAQNLESSVKRSRHFKFLVQDGNERVSAHRDPDLGLHRIGRDAEELLDAQVLFDIANEPSKARHNAVGGPDGGAQRHQQFDLPTIQINRCRTYGVHAFLDTSQTLSPDQLRKAHADQVLSATEVSRANVVALGQAIQRLTMTQIQDLGDELAAGVHGCQSSKQPFPTSTPPH